MAASDGHVIDLEWGAGLVPFDRCEKCGEPVQTAFDGSGRLVTMVGANAECYGRRP